MAVCWAFVLLFSIVVSAFNPNAALISNALALSPVDELSVEILLVNVAESAFDPTDVLRVIALVFNMVVSGFP